MNEDQQQNDGTLLPSARGALALRSTALIRRGLRDLLKKQSRVTSSVPDVHLRCLDQAGQAARVAVSQDPETQKLLDYLLVHGYDACYQLGKVRFEDWANEMRERFKDFKNEIEPHLKRIYDRLVGYGEEIRDLTIIGMGKYCELLGGVNKVDFRVWENRMLSDSDTVKRRLEEMKSNDLEELYLRSKALYVGYQNIFENGEQRFGDWSSYLLSRLDDAWLKFICLAKSVLCFLPSVQYPKNQAQREVSERHLFSAAVNNPLNSGKEVAIQTSEQ